MLRPRFHTSQDLASGARLRLEPEPSRHIAKALRMRVGDRLCLFCGDGSEAEAEITAIDRNAVFVHILECLSADRESPLRITLAISLSRGDRMDTVVQKATELGAAAIWPLVSERTGVRLEPKRLQRKLEHWQRIAVSACEQCGRNRIPAISPPAAFGELVSRAQGLEAATRLILHPQTSGAPAPTHEEGNELLLLVGPEGGFSDAEVEQALAAGFRALQLGPRVLRTETAPLAAIAVAQARWGDLRGGDI
jgi:16S rRNA (uracil1498-N3)-methyltransferase